jgi:hypothetical protein
MNAMRSLPNLISNLAIVVLSSSLPGARAESRDGARMAAIRLYNPTKSAEPCVVEVPVGNLATPSLVDWQNLQLLHNGESLPFALREGKAHWKAALSAPIGEPRAEDLLVFEIPVPAGQWSEVELAAGPSKAEAVLSRQDGSAVVAYPNMKVVIDERTGLLSRLEAYGESLLGAPLGLQFYQVDEGVVKHEAYMGPGYRHSAASMKKGRKLAPPSAKLVSWSSTASLTELNFVLRPELGPDIALTYRIYPNNQIEIASDERPWKGRSPWLDCGLEYELALAGTKEELREFQTRFPLYGFQDYAAAVTSIGTLHRGTATLAFQLGEQSANGRFWHRRLAIYPETEWTHREDLLELLDEGLIVKVLPMSSKPLSERLAVAYGQEAKAAGDVLVERLNKAGIQATAVSQPGQNPQPTLALSLVGDPARLGIAGDGFCIRPLPAEQGIEVAAGTKFGLFRGASCLAQYLHAAGRATTAPLMAQNPVVDLRGGGFGGGTHEVDFPYGSEAEWKDVLAGMITSGMNVMASLGKWGNWQMPVYYKYMPELWRDNLKEYDDMSGSKFSETANRREQGLELVEFLHARGVKVWSEAVVGVVPPTFHEKFPEATMPGKPKMPRFTHPKYRQFLEAYFKELLEVYHLDGFFLCRDDFGDVDDSQEFKAHVAQSRTKSPAWEQTLVLYDALRSIGFKGPIAVYPYFDFYEPRLEPLLPADLLIVGHGSGLGVLTRNFNDLALMGDTWLDNLYAGFRLPTSGNMKRLLGDRGCFWVGGAYCGTELPWQAIGYFGWQPTASVNTFRYDFGASAFGNENALNFVGFSSAYERLWEIMNDSLLPAQWFTLADTQRARIAQEGRHWLTTCRERLDRLKAGSDQKAHEKWFAHAGLYDQFFGYYLRRVELFGRMHDLIVSNKQLVANGRSLPEPLRQQLIAMHEEMYTLARGYEERAGRLPGGMMAATCASKMASPFKELFFAGYDRSLDYEGVLKVKQFDGSLRILPPRLTAGQPFDLEIELQNRGVIPWIAGAGNDLVLQGETKRLGLPERWDYDGPPMVFGDGRVIKLHGVAPERPGAAQIKIDFLASFRDWVPFSQTLELKWP